jgi:hypothetical protein
MMMPIDGGHIKMFIFGATKADIGQTLTGIVEMKVKKEDFGNEVPYLRTQVVPGVESTVNVSFVGTSPELPRKLWQSSLTRANGEKCDLFFTVGYKPIEVEIEKAAEV